MDIEKAIKKVKYLLFIYKDDYTNKYKLTGELFNNDFEAIETVLNELEKKDKRINDLEYSLLDMVMQFANRVKTKGCSYALDTMGLSSLETAFSELDFDDPMPVSKAEEKYKILEKQYFEKVEGK